MANTVKIPTDMLPEDGRFGSGPSKIRPEQIAALDDGATTLLGTSHRQTPVRQLVGSIKKGLSSFFNLPGIRDRTRQRRRQLFLGDRLRIPHHPPGRLRHLWFIQRQIRQVRRRSTIS